MGCIHFSWTKYAQVRNYSKKNCSFYENSFRNYEPRKIRNHESILHSHILQ